MGTSASSNGPGAGVSLDPAWLDDIDIPNSNAQSTEQTGKEDNVTGGGFLLFAPRARFSSARRQLSEYVHSGSTQALRKSLGHYSKTGMGGSKKLANRMRVSSKVASGFVTTFHSLRENPEFSLGKTISDLKAKGASAGEIIRTIIVAVCPKGGSIDEELSRNSGTVALSEFMKNNPDADISNLSDDQIWSLAGDYLGNEAYGRIQIDIGQCFERMDMLITEKIQRMNEMREYIKAEICKQLNSIRQAGNQLTNIEVMIRQAIENTFAVYELEVET